MNILGVCVHMMCMKKLLVYIAKLLLIEGFLKYFFISNIESLLEMTKSYTFSPWNLFQSSFKVSLRQETQ